MPAVGDHQLLFKLAQKYNRPGPRYTSYPPAPHFSDEFGAKDFASSLSNLNADGGLSLYAHLPFCRSLCYYCGCHMVITHRPERIERYLGYLRGEIELVADRIGGSRGVAQLHWGGGTPTYLSPLQISRLTSHIGRHFEFLPEAEISLEADPRGLTVEHLRAAREAGFNRLSLGVQDFDARVQKAINREQSVELVAEATAAARRIGFEGVNFDLVYGLPHQSLESFSRTVAQVIEMKPDRISLFSYAHVPWKKKHQKVILDEWLPSARVKLQIFLETVETLTRDGGYRYIGMDHFARPEDALARAADAGTLQRNFQGYSTQAGADLIGLGVSSISRVGNAYSQNVLGLPEYYGRIEDGRLAAWRGYPMTKDDQVRGRVISSIMCALSVDVTAVEREFEIDFWKYFARSLRDLRDLEDDGLVALRPEVVHVTETGRFFIRNVAMAFDAYLTAAPEQGPIYSKTV